MFVTTQNDSIIYAGGKIDRKLLYIKNYIDQLYNKKTDRTYLLYDPSYACWIVSISKEENYMITKKFLEKNAQKIICYSKNLFQFKSYLFGINEEKYVYYIKI